MARKDWSSFSRETGMSDIYHVPSPLFLRRKIPWGSRLTLAIVVIFVVAVIIGTFNDSRKSNNVSAAPAAAHSKIAPALHKQPA